MDVCWIIYIWWNYLQLEKIVILNWRIYIFQIWYSKNIYSEKNNEKLMEKFTISQCSCRIKNNNSFDILPKIFFRVNKAVWGWKKNLLTLFQGLLLVYWGFIRVPGNPSFHFFSCMKGWDSFPVWISFLGANDNKNFA